MKILVAIDGSKGAEKAIKFAAKLASATGSSLTLVYVIATLPTARADIIELFREALGSLEREGEKYLLRGKKIAEKLGAKTNRKRLEGNPAGEILKEVERGRYDLIVVGSYGKGSIDKFLLGSVSSKLVHLSKIPVLVVK